MYPKKLTPTILLFGLTSLFPGLNAQDSNYSIIPLKPAGKFIYIEVNAEGQTGNFIIDTGCSGVLLNSKYFKSTQEGKIMYDINGQTRKIGGRYIDVKIGTLVFPETYALVTSLNTIEEKTPGIPIMGLIGGPFLMEYEITFDFSNGEMTLCRLNKEGEKIKPFPIQSAPKDTFKLGVKGHMTCIKAQIGEAEYCFAIDSGANVNVLNPKNLKKVTPYLKGQRKVKVSGLLGEKTKTVNYGLVTDMKLGTISYLPMQTIIKKVDQYNNNLSGPNFDGILGYPFLVQYKTSINFKRKELYIWEKEKRINRMKEKKELAKNY